MSKRIYVTVGDKIDKKIDEYAEFMGMTKSGLCGYWIAQMVMGYEKAENSVDKVIKNIAENEINK